MSPLPRIACFHGGGSTSAIFSIQCEALKSQLKDEFEFVFFDAPFERDAGPGVLPYFSEKEFGPYRTWLFKTNEGEEIVDGRPGIGKGENGIERVWRLIGERTGAMKGDWVGCMGFSQGTRIVGGLLLDQQRRVEMGFGRSDIDLRFGVLCMGSGLPMESEISDSFVGSKPALIKTPTLHVHGLKDGVYERSKLQLNSFQEDKSMVWDIDYHHAMPWFKADVLKLAQLIRDLYKAS